MTIYLTQGGDDETKVDEIEGKLRSTIRDLKRVPRVEDVDPKSVNGAERSIIILAAAAAEGANVDDLIDVVRRYPRHLFFIVVGGDNLFKLKLGRDVEVVAHMARLEIKIDKRDFAAFG